MMRLALRLETLLRGDSVSATGAAARAAAVASLAGADSLLVTLPAVKPGAWLKPIHAIRDVFDGPVIVASPLHEEALQILLELRPELSVISADGFGPLADEDFTGQTLRSACGVLRNSRAPFAVHLRPEIPRIRAARQLEADAVLLPVAALIEADGTGNSLQAWQELEAATIAADKLGLRVLVEGDLDRITAGAVARLDLVEGVVTGPGVVERALQFGLRDAIQELRRHGRH